MTSKPLVIGLTGSIGMGKSTTAQMFADLGVPVWDADAAVARLYSKNGLAVAEIGALVPSAVQDGSISKDELKEEIARSPNLLAKIEAIVHPLVRADRKAFATDHSDADMILFDIPLLFETGGFDEVDKIVVVSAPADLQRERVLARGTMDDATFQMILSKQMPDAEKRTRADYVIETITLEGARAAVQSLVDELRG